jgi:23S rRNA U2552 (ribose-2'-O)-methylase RlmE/FtsJ
MTKTILLIDNYKISTFKINELIDSEIYKSLIIYKNKIDELNFQNDWDKAKKLGNDYELIYLPNKKNKSKSIAYYQPLSRSYFKLWEIINDFNLLQEKQKCSVLCLAEGPGGFIEAIVNYRRQQFKDNIIGITLKSTDKDIPGWKKSSNFLKNNKNIKITYGADGTGNLYNIENIMYLKKTFSKMDFITADGGFDFSNDFNKQEELSYRIIFCEIVTALSTQKINGTFICKIFDSYTPLTLKFLYLLFNHYGEVYLTKPLTSRPANSEKYIVCKYFKGITCNLLKLLHYYVKYWDKLNQDTILDFIINPYIFVKKIKIFNNLLTSRQIGNIKKTLSLINQKDNKIIIKNQIECALDWCKKYNMKINNYNNYENYSMFNPFVNMYNKYNSL